MCRSCGILQFAGKRAVPAPRWRHDWGKSVAIIGLLGEVTADVAGRRVALGPARQRCVLVALAMDAGHVVAVDRLIERVWAPAVPTRARATLQSYVSRLRQALAGEDGVDILRRPGGYVLTSGETDLSRFQDLCARARDSADSPRAARLLTEALALWRGDALTGLDSEWAQAERDRLHQERLAAEHDLVDVRLRMGRGEELLAGLSARVAEYPLDERVASQYMAALSHAGRAADALAHYRRLRVRLVAELGAEPGAALQDLHQRILGADSVGAAPASSASALVPRQLPAAPAPFVGQRDALDRLDAARRDNSATVVISAIAGAGGIGKTWLALHWAHRNTDRFPDGQLFVDLRGFSPDGPPMTAEVALRGFLDALGVEPDRVPAEVHAQAAMFRSLVADRRMLLVLDNAVDTGQVVPLLPGSETCAVVVTSRNRLSGLITGHGARHVLLDVLSDTEARALLTRRLGMARVDAEPEAVAELIALCGGFPLALSIVAGRAHTGPLLRFADLAAELHDLGLAALDDDDPTASLPVVLSWSVQALNPDQARMFALLGVAPGPDISTAAAVSLAGRPAGETRAVLRELEQASLITRSAGDRCRTHDLIRAHALRQHLANADADAALRRVLDCYLHTAYDADRILTPERPPVRLDPPVPGCQVVPLPDGTAALTWLANEHACLLAAQQTAITRSWHQDVWRLAWVLNTFHYRRGHLDDELAVWQAGLTAADRLGDVTTRILVRRMLGRVLGRRRQYEQATARLHEALTLAEQDQDEVGQAHVHGHLAHLNEMRGDYQRALEHCERTLDLFRALDDPIREAQSLNNMGWLAARLGDHETALRHCQTALALHRSQDYPNGEAHTLDSLGYIEHRNGRPARAVDHYRQALALWRELGNAYEAATTLSGLGDPYATLEQYDQARAVWQEAFELYQAQNRSQDADRVQRRLDGLPERETGRKRSGSGLSPLLVSRPVRGPGSRRDARLVGQPRRAEGHDHRAGRRAPGDLRCRRRRTEVLRSDHNHRHQAEPADDLRRGHLAAG